MSSSGVARWATGMVGRATRAGHRPPGAGGMRRGLRAEPPSAADQGRAGRGDAAGRPGARSGLAPVPAVAPRARGPDEPRAGDRDRHPRDPDLVHRGPHPARRVRPPGPGRGARARPARRGGRPGRLGGGRQARGDPVPLRGDRRAADRNGDFVVRAPVRTGSRAATTTAPSRASGTRAARRSRAPTSTTPSTPPSRTAGRRARPRRGSPWWPMAAAAAGASWAWTPTTGTRPGCSRTPSWPTSSHGSSAPASPRSCCCTTPRAT